MQAARRAWPCKPRRWPLRAQRSIAVRPSPWSESRRGLSATCSRARPSTIRSMPTPPTCSFFERCPTASQSQSIRSRPSWPQAARASRSPAEVLLQPIFNPVGGYASFIVPAAFVLLLQQMLLIGASMLTVVALAQSAGGAFASVLGRGIAHLTIYFPALALYFIVLPRVYGFSTLGHPLQLFALASLFTLATSFMGQAAGAWFKHPETPTLIFLGTSLPQLFVTGFSWPREAIPRPALIAGYIFPSDFAIDGIVRIGQLGASLWEVARDWRGLWALAAVYFVLAVISAFLVKRRRAHA